MLKILKMGWIWIALGLIVLPVAQAGIYQCVSPEGIIEYRDRPCKPESSEQTFIPIQYQVTDAKQIKKEEKSLKISQKQLTSQDKKIAKKKQSNIKILKNQKNQQERLKKRCARLDEKINHIESQLRAGCTLKKANRLKTQLEVCQSKKADLCANE
jgi:hypothetical protein